MVQDGGQRGGRTHCISNNGSSPSRNLSNDIRSSYQVSIGAILGGSGASIPP